MNWPLIAVTSLLLGMIAMFISNRPRMDAVAVIAICALPFTGVVTIRETLAGFADPNVVLIATMFIIGDGLVRTGVASRLGDWLAARSGQSITKLILLLMLSVAGLGATMSSTAVTALFIPIVLRICRRAKYSPSVLMLPLSYAALISGMMTLVATTPNLIVQGELLREGYEGFHFFSITVFGLPVLAAATVYMLLVHRWLMRPNESETPAAMIRPSFSDWIKKYKLAKRKHLVAISRNSPIVGETLESLKLRNIDGINIIAIQRDGLLQQPRANFDLRVNDILLVDSFVKDNSIVSFVEKYQLEELPLQASTFLESYQDIGLAEVFVSADSELLSKTIVESKFRTKFNLSVMGLRRGAVAVESEIHKEMLKVGDTLLVVGPWKSIRSLSMSPTKDLVPLNLPTEFDDVLPASRRIAPALLILLAIIIGMVSGVIPNVHVALIGCLLMGIFGCVTLESSYAAIDWKTILLIVGMLPFSTALERTGGVQLASDFLLNSSSGMGSIGLLATLFAITTLMGLFISNTATAILMAPIALSVAKQSGFSPYPFAMIVALASSTAFITPVSSPVNALVMTPGGYRFQDFVKFGLPFAIVTLVISVYMVEWLLPLDWQPAR